MTDEIRSTGKLPPYGRIPRALRLDSRVTDAGRLLYATLDDYCDAGTGTGAFPGRQTLAKETGWSVDKVDRALKSLEDAGWVIVTPRPNQTNLYTLLFDLSHAPQVQPRERQGLNRRYRDEGGREGAATAQNPRSEVAAPVRPGGGGRVGAARGGRVGAARVAAPVRPNHEPMTMNQRTMNQPPHSPPLQQEGLPFDEPRSARRGGARTSSSNRRRLERHFAAFWAAYPHAKTGCSEANAFEAFVGASKWENPETIVAAVVEAWAPHWAKHGHVSNPVSWLRGKRWRDAPPVLEGPRAPESPFKTQRDEEAWERRRRVLGLDPEPVPGDPDYEDFVHLTGVWEQEAVS